MEAAAIDYGPEIAAYHSLLSFTLLTKPDYKVAFFHREVARALEKIDSGDINRLMIFMPFRHGKTELASIRFPAWYMGRHPDRSFISTSYGAELATDHGRDVRDVMSSPLYQAVFPGVYLRADSKSKNNWQTTLGGKFIAAGVGGPITGHGANVLIIDDPIKNQEEADSRIYREKTWKWYLNVARTRLEPNGAMILIQTRWHQDDLAGRLLNSRVNGGWDVINIPAWDESRGWLWPERYSPHEYESLKEELGPRSWSAMAQQNPIAPEGSIFKLEWFPAYDPNHTPEYTRIVESWDTAFESSQENDYSVGCVFGQTTTGLDLLEVVRGRWTFLQLKQRLQAVHEKYNGSHILIERKASGHDLINMLRQETSLPIIPINPKGAKFARANAVSGRCQAGRVRLPRTASWLHDFMSELESFPHVVHDDQVDSFAQGIYWIYKTPYQVVIVG